MSFTDSEANHLVGAQLVLLDKIDEKKWAHGETSRAFLTVRSRPWPQLRRGKLLKLLKTEFYQWVKKCYL